jgi:hypothetical protein
LLAFKIGLGLVDIIIAMNKNHKSAITPSASLRVATRAIGNSKGVVIPKIILG